MENKEISRIILLDKLEDKIRKKYNLPKDQERGLPARIAEVLRISTSVVQRWYNGSFPSGKNLYKIHKFLDISIDETLDQEKPHPKEFIAHIEIITEKEKYIIEQTEGEKWKEKFVLIPIAKDPISAGDPITVREEPDGIAIIYKEWARNEKNFTAIRIKGQSMEPTIEDGSIVGIDHSQRSQRELNGKIVALRDPGDNEKCTIKRLHVISKSLMVGLPDNIKQKDKTVIYQGEEVNTAIIGKIAWWWGKQE